MLSESVHQKFFTTTDVVILIQVPFWLPLSPADGRDGPTGVPNSSTQCIWMVRIHITCLGPLTDPYDTPGPVLAPKGPFEGPRGTWRARRVQIWSQLLLIGLTGLESWLPDTLTWYLASSGPPGPPKGPVLAPKGPQRDLGGWEGPDLVPTAANWSDWAG